MARYVQRKGAKMPRKSVLLIVLNILIGIELAGILLILLTFRGTNNDTYYNRKFHDQYSYYSIERGDYAELVNDYYNDWGILGRIKSGSEEAAALADYADAAFYRNAYDKTAAEDGGPVPAIVFQHIPVPEYYDVLRRVPKGTKGAVEAFRTHRNEFYVLPEEVTAAGGFMKESPATPDRNSGEFATLKADGNVLGVLVGHDHINSFVAEKDGVKLIYTQGSGFNVYGPGRQRGVRIITLHENDLSRFDTRTVTFDDLTKDRVHRPLTEFVLTHIPSSIEQVKKWIPLAAVSATAIGLAAVGGGMKLAERKRS